MNSIELELTYLATYLPKDLTSHSSKEILDVYIPESADHSVIRLRKNGDTYEITKKTPVDGDVSKQEEQTISLSKDEFEALAAVSKKSVRKIRYYYPLGEKTAELDVFQDKLSGLVLIDVEFSSEEEKSQFSLPEFALCEVTQELFIAGGYLAGKSYEDIEENLKEFGYTKIV